MASVSMRRLACAGPLLAAELDALGKALHKPRSPVVAIVGGSKVSTKLTVLESLSGIVDQLIPGGGIANTFIAAAGYNVGKSLVEADLIPEARRLVEQAQAQGRDIPVPTDVVCGKEFSETAEAVVKPVSEVEDDDMIFDIGPQTAAHFATFCNRPRLSSGTDRLVCSSSTSLARAPELCRRRSPTSPAFSIAGGGDTLAAVDKYGYRSRFRIYPPAVVLFSSSWKASSYPL